MYMDTLITLLPILHGFLISWWTSNFEPLQDFLKKKVKPKITIPYVNQLLSCHKCQAFFITLAISQNIFFALAASISAYVFERIMNSFKVYL